MHLSIKENSRTWKLTKRYYDKPERYFELSKLFGGKMPRWLKSKERYSKLERTILTSLDLHIRDLESLYKIDPAQFEKLYLKNKKFINRELSAAIKANKYAIVIIFRLLFNYELNGNLTSILMKIKSRYLDLENQFEIKYMCVKTAGEALSELKSSEVKASKEVGTLKKINSTQKANIQYYLFYKPTPEITKLINDHNKFSELLALLNDGEGNINSIRPTISKLVSNNLTPKITKSTSLILATMSIDLGIPISTRVG